MRYGIIAATLTVLTIAAASSAQAETWCGSATKDKAVVECGYSSVAFCQSAVGKDGVCFVDPDYARASKIKGSPAPEFSPNR
jgi:hypothetical protein